MWSSSSWSAALLLVLLVAVRAGWCWAWLLGLGPTLSSRRRRMVVPVVGWGGVGVVGVRDEKGGGGAIEPTPAVT